VSARGFLVLKIPTPLSTLLYYHIFGFYKRGTVDNFLLALFSDWVYNYSEVNETFRLKAVS
jgi:hypothetical protein